METTLLDKIKHVELRMVDHKSSELAFQMVAISGDGCGNFAICF